MEFCKQFNARTQDKARKSGTPVVITVYGDKSFDFRIKDTTSSSSNFRADIKIKKGSSANQIALRLEQSLGIKSALLLRTNLPDMNCFTVDSGMKMVAGTARSMGIERERW